MIVRTRLTFFFHLQTKELLDMEIPFTVQEEEWLANQMCIYQKAFSEVPVGYDWIKEFIMFSYDVPLSRNFAHKGWTTLMERYKGILKCHQGFNELPTKDQEAIWKGGSRKAAALCSVKTENLNTGQEQLQFIFGDQDSETWKQNFEELVTKSQNFQLKKVSMADCNRVAGVMDADELISYMNTVVSLNELTQEPEMFKLLTLVALFSGDELSPEASKYVTEIRNQYMAIIKKRIKGSQILEKICHGLAEVDQLSGYLKKLELTEQ